MPDRLERRRIEVDRLLEKRYTKDTAREDLGATTPLETAMRPETNDPLSWMVIRTTIGFIVAVYAYHAIDF